MRNKRGYRGFILSLSEMRAFESFESFFLYLSMYQSRHEHRETENGQKIHKGHFKFEIKC